MRQELDDYKGVWTLGEIRDGEIHPVSYEMLAWGRGLANDLQVGLACVVMGRDIKDKAQELIYRGADKVYVVDNPALEHFRADPYSEILTSLVKEYKPEIFIASATTMGRTVMPICAVKIGTGLTADCTELEIDLKERLLIQTRPAVGGNIMATIKTPSFRPQMATVRPKSKRPLEVDTSRSGQVVVKEFDEALLSSRVKRIDFIREEMIGVPIQDAEIIVACGKGIQDIKNLQIINELAELLGGSIGASRRAIDFGWVPYSHQVGLSGKTVSPKLYIACGISGAVQHLAGMSSSETIVAINSDIDANIFDVADYGIVGDLFEVVPLLIEKIKNKEEKK